MGLQTNDARIGVKHFGQVLVAIPVVASSPCGGVAERPRIASGAVAISSPADLQQWILNPRSLKPSTQAAAVGAEVGEPDLEAVLHELSAARARAARDVSALENEAAAHEVFGAGEGIPSML